VKRKTPRNRNRSGYKIGYGRPPKETQFKKGTSGNNKGRPKGTKNIATLFHQEMYQRVTISENGERRTITKAEAALKQLVNKAATGDPKAIQAMINIARELGDLKLPDLLQEPKRHTFTLNVFQKDLETGERIRVNPANRQTPDNDDDD
jgi:hypothetical protein